MVGFGGEMMFVAASGVDYAAYAVDEPKPADLLSFKRVTKELPAETAEIKPHPYGVELGVLMQMFRDTKARNVKTCLQGDFARVSAKVAGDIIDNMKG